MNNLTDCYLKGIGTEKDYNKAFDWHQKVAEKSYKNLESTKKNFHWYQKEAENGNEDAMVTVAICYQLGEETEKNLEKAVHWYQKAAENAAENGYEEAMHNLANCYMDGIGIEKNFENAVCWYQKAAENAENDKANFENKVELCNECKKLYIDYQWCQQCNSRRFQKDFSKWTSKNEFIDNFIQEAQLNAKNSYEVLEWIPFDKLSNINYHDKGGFSEIHKAIWLDGPIYSWDFDKQRWNRWKFQMGYEIILKILNNSSNLSSKFLDEV
ncbi:kinase-like domain-containing protein [Rhizophagus clarus]|uniref:Kinase-like domain-containing protein n=1 Tax=Rhizophagus clarus TaxID=94130 RepID=A0A8H3LDS7_9GLOM|nr:kinase-like domain-containing protein [Rhizophagus clarus]